jgi:hypothetical protein
MEKKEETADGSVEDRWLERRTFIHVGLGAAVVGSAALGSAGCGAGALGSVLEDPARLARLLGRLDVGLDELGSVSLISELTRRTADTAEAAGPEARTFAERGDELSRRFLRALLFAGSLHELGEEEQAAPEVRSHVERMSSELDETVAQSMELLTTCPEEERRGLSRALEEQPELVMELSEVLDRQSRALGMGAAGRRRLRAISTSVSSRLRRQPASLLIDECTDEVARITAQIAARTGAAARPLRADCASKTIWGTKEKNPEEGEAAPPEWGETLPAPVETPAATAEAPPATETVSAPPPATTAPQQPPAEEDAVLPLPQPAVVQTMMAPPPSGGDDNEPNPELRGRNAQRRHGGATSEPTMYGVGESGNARLAKAGGIVMGVGAAVLAIGGGVSAVVDIAGWVMMTIGGILLLVGIIILAVGAARRNRSWEEMGQDR